MRGRAGRTTTSIAVAAIVALLAALLTPGARAAARVGGELVLYEFDEGSGSTITDTSGVGAPLDLTIADLGNVTWGPGGLTIDAPTIAQSAGSATKVIDAVTASNAVTVELWVEPTNTTQDGPARMLSISSSATSRNLTVGQGRWGSQPSTVFDTRLRTTATNSNGRPSLTAPTGSATTELTHVVFTRTAAGVTTIYVDGVAVAVGSAGGSLSNWSSTMPLMLGNEIDSSRPWLGRYCLAAVYGSALTAAEVQQNTNAGCETVNTPPTAVDDAAQVVQGETVTIDVAANDIDDDGTVDPSTIQVESDPSAGTAVVDGTAVTYTSTGGTGEDTFTYTIADDDGDRSDAATVTVDVRAANVAPVIDPAPGDQTNAEGDTVSLPVEATDDNGDTLGYDATGLPPELSIDPSTGVVAGTLTQTSAGSYTVTVTVADGFGGEDSATFDWTVDAVNVAPVIDAIADQQDPAGEVSLQVVAEDLDGDPITYDATGLPTGVSINPDTGLISGPAEAGSYTVTVTASDPTDGEDSEEFAWEIVDVVVQPIVEYEFDEGSGSTVADTSGVGTPLDLTVGIPSNTTWLPNGLEIDAPTIVSSASAATKVSQAVASSGEVTVDLYVRPGLLAQDGPARILSISSGATTRNLTVGQGTFGGAPKTTYDVRLRSTTSDSNGRPSLTTPGGTLTDELQHVVYTRAADGTTTITVDGAVAATGTTGGTLANWSSTMPLHLGNESGVSRPWIGAYCYAAVYAEVVPLSELALRQDGCDLADDNAAPVIDPIADQTSDRGDAVDLQATATDTDGDTVTFSGTGFPPGVDIDDDGLIAGTVDDTAGGDYDVTVTASDPSGASDSTSFTWTVTIPNTPPTAVDDAAQVVQGEAVTIDVAANDTDDDGTVNPASIQIETSPSQGTAVLDGTQVTYTSTGTTGDDTFTYTIADDDGDRSDPATVTVDVRAANVAPVIDPAPGDQTNAEGDTVSLPVEATDDNGDTLSYDATGLPAGLAIDPSTGQITGTLTQTSAGSYTVTVTVADGFGGEDSATFDWTVDAVNVAPVLDAIADQQDTTGDSVSVTASAVDDDGDTITYDAVGLPAGVTIDAASGEITGTITDVADAYAVTVTATDEGGAFDEASFTWTVLEPDPRADGAIALYEFEEGAGSTVADTSGVGDPLDLTIADPGNVSWAPGALTLDTSTALSSAGDATKIVDAVVGSDEVSVETWITPSNTTQDGPARILSISESPFARDLTLGQGTFGSAPTDTFDFRLRTTTTNNNGTPSTTTPAGAVTTEPTHVVATRAADGTVVLYVDGVAVETSSVGGTLDDWAPMPLLLGNEADGDRAWLGTYCLAAVYDRALAPGEVAQNFDAGCEVDSVPSGVVTILDGSDSIEGSTFSAGSFMVANTATDGTTLTSFSLDLSTALYHDVVFDPDGDAGDAGSKCFTPDAGDASTVGLQEPAGGTPGSCDNSMLSGPNAGGYDVITLTFDDFDPGEDFGFSIDNDPTSIQGVPITGNSGAISGFELAGSTVTLSFEGPGGDTTELTGRLFAQDATDANGVNDGASELVLSSSQAPVGPVTIDVVGATPADLGYPNGAAGAVVADAAQQVAIDGPAGADVRLLVVESSFDEPVGFDKDPFEANKAEVITTYDVTLDGTGSAVVDVTLPDAVDTFDDNNGDLYYLYAGVAAGGTYPSTSNLVYLELDPTAGPAAPVVDAIANQVIVVGETLELPVTATDANGDEITLTLDSTPDITALGATFDQPVAGEGQATLTWTPTLDHLGSYDVTIIASDTTPAPDGVETFTITVTDEASTGSALIAINPGSAGIDASTFGNGSFQITNTSTGGETITGVSFDLSTSWLPDVVFDPIGTAGDGTAKCLTPNSGASATGFVAPSDPCVDPFSDPHDGVGTAEGYNVLSASFTDFGASETFTFSVDVDPTSIKDVPTSGNAGSISGFELTGSTVTVTFDDGTVVVEPFRTGTSNGGASVVADATPRDTVTLDVAGVTLAPQPELSDAHSAAAVLAPTQTVLVTGPPNADVRLLRVEAARVQTPSYDPDPFEANKAIAIEAYDVSLDGTGQGQVEVTLTDTATGTVATDVTGLNHLMAVIGEGETTGPLSNIVVLDLVDGPTAVDDNTSTTPGVPVEIDVLANDTGPVALDPTSVTVTSGPTGGFVTGPDATTGALTYNPEQSFDDDDGDSFTYTVEDTDGNVSNEATVTITDETATGVALYRVNAGGDEYVDTLGQTWSADANFLNGTAFPTSGPKTGEAIAGTEDDLLYQSERFGGGGTSPPLEYAFDVAPGTYTVEVHLAEIYFGATTSPSGPAGAGQRVFSGTAEGQPVFTDLDLYAEDGAAVARVETITVEVTDGELNLVFSPSADNAKVSALAVLSGEPPTDVPPTVTPIGDATVQVDQSLSVPITTSEPDGDTVTLSWSSTPDASGFATFADAGDGTGTLTFDPAAGDVGTYDVTVTASDVDGSDDETFTLTVTEPPTGGEVLARINAGGPELAAVDGGPVWEADQGSTGHPYLTDPGSGNTNGFPAVEPGPTVPSTVPGAVFDTERWSSSGFAYGVPVASGTQVLVRLYAGNGFSGTSEVGQRVFDISIDGVVVENDLDLVDRFGHQVGGMLEYLVTSDGTLDIAFSNVVENPLLNGLEVVVADSSPGELGVSPTAIDFGQTLVNGSSTETITLSNLGFEAGDPTIEVTDVTVTGGEFTTDFPAGGISLPAGGSETFDVTFAPTTTDAQTGTLDIAHDAANTTSPVTVTLAGVGSSDIPVSFTPSGLSGESLTNPTSLEFGPDGRLYVSQQNGIINAYTVDRVGPNDYDVTDTETIDLIPQLTPNHDDDGSDNSTTKRQVTGLVTAGTATNPVLYVSSSDWRISVGDDSGLDTNSGLISRLTWTGTEWEKIDIVRGLPRSEENHSTNGLDIDPATNTLYVMQGGHANKGAPSNNFSGTPEYYLSAALLSVDLDAIDAMDVYTDARYGTQFVYDLPTLADPDSTRGTIDNTSPDFPYPSTHPRYGDTIDVGDPFGGNNGTNQAIPEPGGPVQIFSPGYRNAYDVVLTEGGKLYTSDNGPNGGWGGQPLIYDSLGDLKGHEGQSGVDFDAGAGDYCTNEFNEGGSSGHGDPLFHIDAEGYYGGHPTPIRAFPGQAGVIVYEEQGSGNWVEVANHDFLDLLPPGLTAADFPDNPVECDYQADDSSKYLDIVNSSTNGITEYTASNFGGAMQGNLLTASFNGDINRYVLNAAGDDVLESEAIFTGFGDTPLDVVAQGDADPFPGTVWAATYGANNITVFEPGDFDGSGGPTCTGADDPALDEDGDGYTNADEIAAGTNPCSAASVPPDFDDDGVSDVTDLDDDGDGIDDVDDPFAIDPENGTTTSLPVERPFTPGVPGTGFFGLGFTGLMSNGTTDYLDQFDEGQLAAGGAGGVFTVEGVPDGDAYQTNNDQLYGFQYGVDVDQSTAPFVVSTSIEAPVFDGVTPSDFQSAGLQIGDGTQASYLKVVVAANGGAGGVQVLYEDGDVQQTSATYGATAIGGDVLTGADLSLVVDPAALTAQPQVAVGGGAPVDLGPAIDLPATWFSDADSLGLAVGIIATSFNATPFDNSWDFLDVTPLSGVAPTISAADDVGVEEGASDSIVLDILDTDGDTLTIDVQSSPDASGFLTETLVENGPGDYTLTLDLDPQTGDAGTYDVTVSADDGNNPATTEALQVTVTEPSNVLFRVNAGGPEVPAADGSSPAWSADSSTAASPYRTAGGTNIFSASAGNAHPGAIDMSDPSLPPSVPVEVFEIERWDGAAAPEMLWEFPVADGTEVEVRLFFAELFSGVTESGQRVFDVSVEGSVPAAFDDIDQYAIAGAKGAFMLSTTTTVGGGDGLAVEFLHDVIENPAVKGIEILEVTAPTNADPVIDPITDPTVEEGDSMVIAITASDPDVGDTVTIDATGLPSFASFDQATDELTLDPVTGDAGASPYSITITADDGNGGTDTVTVTVTVTEPAPAPDPLVVEAWTYGNVLHRVNAGGPEVAAGDGGVPWSEDQVAAGAGGTAGTGTESSLLDPAYAAQADSEKKAYGTGDAITLDPSMPAGVPTEVLQVERWDPSSGLEMGYDLPVPVGAMAEVRVYLAEVFQTGEPPTPRVFDIQIDGVTVAADVDPLADYGHDVGFMLPFVVESDGTIDLDFIHVSENPAVKAVEVVELLDAAPAEDGDTIGLVARLTNPAGNSEDATLDTVELVVDGGSGSSIASSCTPAPGVPLPPSQTTTCRPEVTVSGPSDTLVNHVVQATGSFADGTPIDVSSAPVSIVIVPPLLAAPTGLTSEAGVSVVGLTWDDDADVDGWNVYRGTSSGVTPETGTLVTGSPVTDPVLLDSDVINGTTYHYVVTAVLGAEESAASGEVSGTPDTVRINAAGPTIVATDGGPDWASDDPAHPFLSIPSGSSLGGFSVPDRDASVPLYVPQDVFQTERWDGTNGTAPDDLTYAIPVAPSATVTVNLLMANGWDGTDGAGERLFDVYLEETLVLDEFDLTATYGHATGGMVTFPVTDADGDGDVEIVLEHGSGPQNPLVNAIEVAP